MKVLLIDIDSKIPNLALMKLSAWHKKQGDVVEFNNYSCNPDKIYASCVYTENAGKVKQLPFNNVIAGGSGLQNWDVVLPEEIEHIMPDYSLHRQLRGKYKDYSRGCRRGDIGKYKGYSLGFTTRGCIRNCPWCIVQQKEGKIRTASDIYEFWNRKHKEIVLLDNNILALPEHFEKICKQIKKNNLRVDFNQGLDIRLVDDKIARILSKLKYIGPIRFSFDETKYKEEFIRGMNVLKKHVPVYKFMIYVLMGFASKVEEDIERLTIIKECRAKCYIMVYRGKADERLYRLFRSYAHFRPAYNTVTFGEWLKYKKIKLGKTKISKASLQKYLNFTGKPETKIALRTRGDYKPRRKRSPKDIQRLARKIRGKKEFIYQTTQLPIDLPSLVAKRGKAPDSLLISKKMSFKQKDKEAVNFVRAAIKKYNLPYWISMSGGKDSTVLGHIVRRVNPNVPMVFCDTTNEFPELINHVRDLIRKGWNIDIRKPNVSFAEGLQKFGPPARRNRWCCKILKAAPLFEINKKIGAQKVLVFIGIRASESSRRSRYERIAETYAASPVGLFRLRQTVIYPLLYFNKEDIWDYIKKYNVPYCSLYDNYEINRLGCMFCPFTSDTYDRAVTALYPKKSKEWIDYLKKYAKDNALDESWAEGAWRNHFRIKKYTYVGTKEVIGVRSLRYRFQEPFSPQQKKFFIPFRDRDVIIKFFPGDKTMLVSQPKWDAYNLLLHVENQIIKALNCINCGWCQIVCNHIDMGKDSKIYIKDSCTGCLKCTYKSPCMVIREGAQIDILKESGNDRWGRKTRRVY